jgi:hypothetical protein
LSRDGSAAWLSDSSPFCGSFLGIKMQDLFWIGLMVVLLGATLGYIALCGRA